jgi:DNA-binding NarL/FixJ family response regulator
VPHFRILVADDHEIVRQGICSILQRRAGWQVCGEVADGRLAVAKCRDLQPDLAILDIGMPHLNGLEATRQITNSSPLVKVLIFSVSGSEHTARKALEAGAHGYLLKSDAGNELINAVDALRNNRPFWHLTAQGGFFRKSLNSYGASSEKVLHQVLSTRELEVLQLIAAGKVSKDIATALGVGVKTIETHRAHLMHKLDLHSVAELVLYAVKNDLVQLPSRTY